MTAQRHTRLITLALLALAVVIAALAIRVSVARLQTEDLIRADPEATLTDERLRPVALSLGKTVFAQNCASCHGGRGQGDGRGAPDMSDGDWLYGQGKVAEIEQTILYGIRSGNGRGWNLAYMPAYARAKPYKPEAIDPLRPIEIQEVATFVRSLRDPTGLYPATVARGAALYAGKGGCWDCHGGDAGGDPAIGAPNLVDDVWLYGDGSIASIGRSVAYGRAGLMPAFIHRLTAIEVRAVAAYVASLSQSKGNGRDHGA